MTDRRFVSFALNFAVALLLGANTATAEPAVCASRPAPQNCGGAVPCCCGDAVTEDYTLPGDLDCTADPIDQHGLRINAANVVLDGAGFSIHGPTSLWPDDPQIPGREYDTVGIKVESTATKAVIKNIRVVGGDITIGTWRRCIEVKANKTVVGDGITQVITESCGWIDNGENIPGSYGVDVDADDVTVEYNLVKDVGDEGIHIGGGSDRALILNNVVENPGLEAIYLLRNQGAQVIGNVTSGSDDWGLHMKEASGALIEGNTFSDRGITLRGDCTDNLLKDNTAVRRLVMEAIEDDNNPGQYLFPANNLVLGGQIDGLEGEDPNPGGFAGSDHCVIFDSAMNNRLQSVSLIRSVQAAVRTLADPDIGTGIYQNVPSWPVNTLTDVSVDGSALVINDPELGGDDVEFTNGTIIILETAGTPVVEALPVADGYIWTGLFSGDVFSTLPRLRAHRKGGCNPQERISLLKFDVPHGSTGAIDATLNVMSSLDMTSSHAGFLHGVDPAANVVTEPEMSWDWFNTAFPNAVPSALRQGFGITLEPGAAQDIYTPYDVTHLFQLYVGPSSSHVMYSFSGHLASGYLTEYYSKETTGKEPKLSFTPVTAQQFQLDATPPLDTDCGCDEVANPSCRATERVCNGTKEGFTRSNKPKESNGDKNRMEVSADDGMSCSGSNPYSQDCNNDTECTGNGTCTVVNQYESYLTFDILPIDAEVTTATLFVHVRNHENCAIMGEECSKPRDGKGPKVYVLQNWQTDLDTSDDGWEEGTGDSDVTTGSPLHPTWLHWDVVPPRGRFAGRLAKSATDPEGSAVVDDGEWWSVELSHAVAEEVATGNDLFTLILVGSDNKHVKLDGMRNNESDGFDRPTLVFGDDGTATGVWPPDENCARNATCVPTEDSWTKTSNDDPGEANENHGLETVLHVESPGGDQREIYVKFDVTGLTSDATGATLRLFREAITGEDLQGFQFYEVTDDTWAETAITWNNAPASGNLLGTLNLAPNTIGWIEFSNAALNNYINAQRVDGDVSIAIKGVGPDDRAKFQSREGVNPPEMVLQ